MLTFAKNGHEKQKIKGQGLQIQIDTRNETDYISLTDIARKSNDNKPAYTILNWFRNQNPYTSSTLHFSQKQADHFAPKPLPLPKIKASEMSKKKELTVRGKSIRIKEINGQEMFSLTDIANRFGEGRSERILFRWFKNQSTLDFLEAYDEEYNPNFKSTQMGAFKMEALKNSNTYTLSDYQKRTGSPFVSVTKGRYGGSWAVFDIAAELMMWISARFKVWFIADYKRMKVNELKSNTTARLWESQKKVDALMEVLRFEQGELRRLQELNEAEIKERQLPPEHI